MAEVSWYKHRLDWCIRGRDLTPGQQVTAARTDELAREAPGLRDELRRRVGAELDRQAAR